MGRGRKKTPLAILKLRGSRRMGDRERTEPKFKPTRPRRPAWLLPIAKTEWDRLIGGLVSMGVMTDYDTTLFAAYCQQYAMWREAQKEIVADGGATQTDDKGKMYSHPAVKRMNDAYDRMLKAALEFGMSPVSRAKVIVEPEEADDLTDFLAKKQA